MTEERPRGLFRAYFTPTPASRLRMIEHCFRGLTENRMRRSTFRDRTQFLMAAEQQTCRTRFSRDDEKSMHNHIDHGIMHNAVGGAGDEH
jgi:hypothetical protein